MSNTASTTLIGVRTTGTVLRTVAYCAACRHLCQRCGLADERGLRIGSPDSCATGVFCLLPGRLSTAFSAQYAYNPLDIPAGRSHPCRHHLPLRRTTPRGLWASILVSTVTVTDPSGVRPESQGGHKDEYCSIITSVREGGAYSVSSACRTGAFTKT